MNRENKKMKYEKGYYKTHPCTDSFTCRNCGRLVVSAGAGSSHRNQRSARLCLASLHLEVEPGDRESECGGANGTCGRMGAQKRRVGNYPPLPYLRRDEFKPRRRR